MTDEDDFFPPPVLYFNGTAAASGSDKLSPAGVTPSRWRHAGGSEAEADRSSRFYADLLVDDEYLSAGVFTCPSNDGMGPMYDTSTSPWTLIGEIGPALGYQITPFFRPYRDTAPAWRGWGAAPTAGSIYLRANLTSLLFKINLVAYPTEGMLMADQTPGDRSVFSDGHGYVTRSQHNSATTMNSLHFDGHVEQRDQYNFWPYYRYRSVNTWYRSKFWCPTVFTFGDRGAYLDW